MPLNALADALADVGDRGGGRLVLMSGEAGVGKTALLTRFCVEQERGRILWGACDALFTPRPLGPLLDVAEETGGEFEELVRAGALPHDVASALAQELIRRRRTILVLEDIHWADEATLDVLRLLGRRLASVPTLVLASYRDTELGRFHPLRQVLGEFVSDATTVRLRLSPLSPAAVSRLAEPYGADPADLYAKSGGNPFYVTEALAAGDADIPATVRDAVLARAARLDPQSRGVLEVVAVIPPPARLTLVEALAGEAITGLDECLAAGMLVSDGAVVTFRHELARLAVEEAVAPERKLELHRTALAALDKPGTADLARLAHHAEAAGNTVAVHRFAPAAAAQAAALGAHFEAAAQYARALRFGDGLSTAERAELLESHAHECYLTDRYDEGMAALDEEVDCRRALGDRRGEGAALTKLSAFLWCPGRTAEAERCARDAIAVLEELPPGRELAAAYANLADSYSSADRSEDAVAWAERALDLAKRLDYTEIVLDARSIIGACSDYELLEQVLEENRRAGLDERAAMNFVRLARVALDMRRLSTAPRYIEAGIEHCSDRGFELGRLYLLSDRARVELEQGRWSEAADTAASVLRVRRTSTTPRIRALAVLALVRARRGDPEVHPLLDEAWELAEPTGELVRMAPVATARAEAAWLSGQSELVAGETQAVLDLALDRSSIWAVGELACWRQRAGVQERFAVELPAPCALELAGAPEAAARAWAELGYRYKAALALAQADEHELLRQALEQLSELEARPASEIVARKLRERGVRGLPRGPRAASRTNEAGLTGRELEVLALVAEGLRNGEIATRLFLSHHTVERHVSAILRKLGVKTRGQASAEAVRLGLLRQSS